MKLVSTATTTADPELSEFKRSFEELRGSLRDFLKGKDNVADGMLCALLSSGHVLLEDVPGVGKTTVIKALSKMIGLEMKRIQCTSDLLPSDIIGVEIFDAATQSFRFHPGPIFANVVLADELNRTSPRTQSALLEAMGEGFVSVDRSTLPLPTPFVLFATQNPSDHLGTYPLPESQLDRFAVKLHLDYPAAEKETEIFQRSALDPVSAVAHAVFPLEHFNAAKAAVESVHVGSNVASYVKRVVDATRSSDSLKRGVSTRGGIAWLRVAKAYAFLQGRAFVTPDDLQSTATMCLSHRVLTHSGADARHVITTVLGKVSVD